MDAIREYLMSCTEFYEFHPFLTGVFVSLFSVLFLSLIAECILLYRRSHKVKFLSFDTLNGTVDVSVNAISGLIRTISADFQEINLDNIYLIRSKKKIVLCMTVEYICGARVLVETIDLFEERILDELEKTLGISSVEVVRTKVRNVKASNDDVKKEPQLAEVPVIPE